MWGVLTPEEVERIQQVNLPFFKCDDLESMIACCFRVPLKEEEGHWMLCKEVFDELQIQFPSLLSDHSTKVKIGQVLRYMGCASQHSRYGQMYQLINKRTWWQLVCEVLWSVIRNTSRLLLDDCQTLKGHLWSVKSISESTY